LIYLNYTARHKVAFYQNCEIGRSSVSVGKL
jgi:hypothetical protein